MQQELIAAALMLYENIRSDIENASTRIEHIRISALAQEAQNLLTDLEKYVTAANGSNGSTGSTNVVIDSNGEEETN